MAFKMKVTLKNGKEYESTVIFDPSPAIERKVIESHTYEGRTPFYTFPTMDGTVALPPAVLRTASFEFKDIRE